VEFPEREECFDDVEIPTLAAIGFNVIGSNDAEIVLAVVVNEYQAEQVAQCEYDRENGFELVKVISLATGREVTLENYRTRRAFR
jgi:hypothetical protein